MRIIDIKNESLNTRVYLSDNLLNKVNENLKIDSKVFIISEEAIPKSYQDILLKQYDNAYLLVLKNGEKTKSLKAYSECISFLLKNNCNKDDVLIALGGGVIGDLTGFVASTYHRGIRWVLIPTSTLSQIDSSIGGKCALNFDGIKNVIGSFYQSTEVFIDFNLLKTLSERHFLNGVIEALKIGLLFDNELVDLIEEDCYKNIEEIIYRSIILKKEVVQLDEKENGYRQILNFGHTIGHAIESIANEELYHGECVALGMLFMIDNDKLYNRVKNILIKMKIDLNYQFKINELKKRIELDKKNDINGISVTILDDIGKWKLIKVNSEELLIRVEEYYEKHNG
ncbi:MAG: 3-dehydroquinate synthase [Anaerorhabdus sp.]